MEFCEAHKHGRIGNLFEELTSLAFRESIPSENEVLEICLLFYHFEKQFEMLIFLPPGIVVTQIEIGEGWLHHVAKGSHQLLTL